MGKHEGENNKTILYVVIAIVIIAVIAIGIYFVINQKTDNTNAGGITISKNIKDETITKENYEDMMDKLEKEMKNDEELYYLSYSMMYYMMKDGLASAFTNNTDESVIYTNIYGKTVKQLIDEGKQLMKDNNMTIEKYKEQLESANNKIQ